MGNKRINVVADNIISPLGMTTEDNFKSLLEGHSELSLHKDTFGLPEPFVASLLDRDKINGISSLRLGKEIEKYSFFERICILSAGEAIAKWGGRPESEKVIFILSTTKGNVDRLTESDDISRCLLTESAKKIARYFRNSQTPIVVSNACISGVCAQIEGIRELLAGHYETAIVIGADVLSKFIISGFQSFKALSENVCRPYDKDRKGLNLGEAAGTLILTTHDNPRASGWYYAASSIHNDANHISGPSRTGEGSYRVLQDILDNLSDESGEDTLSRIAFVNAHGTATAYNDEMESIAIHRANLDRTPVNGLKGFYGHTLGAAGIIESILSMKALDSGIILPTRGYQQCGTSYCLDISPEVRKASGDTFIKLLSGFGGSNAGIAYTKTKEKSYFADSSETGKHSHDLLQTIKSVKISPDGAFIDNTKVSSSDITGLYKEFAGDYPKFYKMDNLCRLGFIAAELALKDLDATDKENAAVILFNKNGSLITDRNYQATISENSYFPSPSLFVYTLANIVTGEIAIRHKIFGETMMMITDADNESEVIKVAKGACLTSSPAYILSGWADWNSEKEYLAHLILFKTQFK